MQDLTREITLEFVRVTEAAALKASRWMGKGNKEAADQAAVDAMRGMLDLLAIRGRVIIGEGEKDEAPMLYIGERVGGGGIYDPEVDIAVDPLDGTSLTAKGLPNALSVMAAGNAGTIKSFPTFYVDKIAVGPGAKGQIDINAPVEENLKRVALAYACHINELTVVILERPRHGDLIEKVRRSGARCKLISDGDISGAISTSIEDSGVDLLLGIGGAPEGVLAAAALRCLGGEIQVKMFARDEAEKKRIAEAGYSDLEQVYCTEDLAKGDSIIFAATGVTGGDFLPGVRFSGHTAITHSVVMRARTRTVRYIKAIHHLDTKTIPSRGQQREVEI
ncbi:MAG: class II fructose-bisphosphatase [Coprothermobacterota bacterium]|nr:class II fructose-bisphosphatase [Coprothermobacterota bacterium]